jgi:hypothetical protein
MERRSRLVLFGVGVVIVALIYLLYQAAERTLRAPGETGIADSGIEDDAENPVPLP